MVFEQQQDRAFNMDIVYGCVDNVRVGVLGGGQLGRMMGYAAHRLGVELTCLDALGAASPAGLVCSRAITGAFTDADAVNELAQHCDVITVEIEHVNVDALRDLVEQGRVQVRPSPTCLAIVRDKLAQKEAMAADHIPVVDFRPTSSPDAIIEAAASWDGFPVMLKTRFAGYDGRGNAPVRSPEEADAAFEKLGRHELYVERWAEFRGELAVMVARGVNGDVRLYPVVETRQSNSVCELVFVPPLMPISAAVEREAMRVAQAAVEAIDGVGIFGVELFLMHDGRVLVNEIAPRPHNSGHYSIEACVTDQFEQHLRAVAGLPLGDASLRVPAAAMLNVFGGDSLHLQMRRALDVPGCNVHWYGKQGNRAGRKMAHLTLTADNQRDILTRLAALGHAVEADPHVQPVAEGRQHKNGRVDVGVIMGSDSDLPTMKACCEILRLLGISFEVSVVSAHRTPERMFEYARDARSRGLSVLVAGAGGAAHLPGMVASLTTLPVIGVPVKTSTLSGVDSLYSIVQMPRGVPVATVAIGNAMNAGLLAARMLATSNAALAARLEAFSKQQREEVLKKANRLEDIGEKQYLEEYTASK